MLVLKRSILTEKIARRGFHLSREYAVDPLEILFVREVMRTNIAALPSDLPIHRIRESLRVDPAAGPQRLYPVVDSAGRLEGVVTRFDLTQVSERAATGQPTNVHEVVHRKPAVAFPDEPLRVIVHRMAMSGLTRFPVLERGADRRLVGVISLEDLLKARVQNLEAEHRRERLLRVRIAFPFGLERTKV